MYVNNNSQAFQLNVNVGYQAIISPRNFPYLVFFIIALLFLLVPDFAAAAELASGEEAADGVTVLDGDEAFSSFYNFIYTAATGSLGRGLALTGGVIGLGFGAASGKALPAIVGVILALFGALGPSIINALFDSALI